MLKAGLHEAAWRLINETHVPQGSSVSSSEQIATSHRASASSREGRAKIGRVISGEV
jgi:hypothetical protein